MWSENNGCFNYITFYNIVDYFEVDLGPENQADSTSLLAWWTRSVTIAASWISTNRALVAAKSLVDTQFQPVHEGRYLQAPLLRDWLANALLVTLRSIVIYRSRSLHHALVNSNLSSLYPHRFVITSLIEVSMNTKMIA